MKKSLIGFIKEFIKVIIIVAIAVPFISLFAAWSEPSSAPTGGNAAAPINVGAIFQTKNGGVELKGGLIAGSIIDKGALLLSPFAPNFSDPEVQAAMLQDGVIYYDSTAKKFRCYEDGTWKDCAGTSAGGGGFTSFQVFDTPGTYNWTIPAGVPKVMIEVWGGGGMGLFEPNGTYASGSGGGGGGYGKGIFSVNPGSSYSVIVGKGGVVVLDGGDHDKGENGGRSSFGSFIYANGGQGGEPDYDTVVPGDGVGTGGTSNGAIKITGENGSGQNGGNGANGGSGGKLASNDGPGPGVVNSSIAPGGGGYDGQAGAPGRVIVWW